jgi:anthranilate phosphoribosyltransferase
MKNILHDLINHQTLSKAEARDLLMALAGGQFNAAQASAFLTVFMMRNITIGELEGFRDAMLELCLPMHFDEPVMDVCGTGGDGKDTFNISTLASFVVAAAGQPVAKHGNYGVSSPCGSSNVLEFFGCRFKADAERLKQSLAETNICFMHAPHFHPAMKNVAPIRKELAVKTFFNMLGPMVNPARPDRQLVGVFSLELARQYGYLYQQTGKSFVILHATDGYDEISLTGAVKLFSNLGEELWEPARAGFALHPPEAIRGGGSVAESAEIFLRVLEGRGAPAQNEVVIANAALALWAADQTQNRDALKHRAREALESGKALACFKKFVQLHSN